jgi:hypothetical protein
VQMILRVRRGLLGDELLQMISRVRNVATGRNPCVDHLRVRHCWLGGEDMPTSSNRNRWWLGGKYSRPSISARETNTRNDSEYRIIRLNVAHSAKETSQNAQKPSRL